MNPCGRNRRGGAEAVTGEDGLVFFQTSELPHDVLTNIWRLADDSRPYGQLSKPEFFTACKLVALAQADIEVSLEKLSVQCHAPSVGSFAESDV